MKIGEEQQTCTVKRRGKPRQQYINVDTLESSLELAAVHAIKSRHSRPDPGVQTLLRYPLDPGKYPLPGGGIAVKRLTRRSWRLNFP
jgi:hypothetical protein